MSRLTWRNPKDGKIYLYGENADVVGKLADYEDAEEQGLLLKLPCRVGDTVFLVQCGKVYERKVNGFSVTSNNRFVVHIPDSEMDNATFPVEQFGKTIFLSRESALAEKGGAE
jgi:hypothetical protein